MAATTTTPTRFLDSGTGAYRPTEHAVALEIPPGVYRVGYSDFGMYFRTTSIIVDTYVHVPGSTASQLREDIDSFLAASPTYAKYGYVHKRAYLLHGVPGTGKTCIAAAAAASIVERGGVVVLIDNKKEAPHELAFIKRSLSGREIGILIEEFDRVYSDSLLNTLDGEDAVPGSILLCTTNHLADIPSRVRNRPGRFDRVVEVGYPSAAERLQFLTTKLLGDSEVAAKWTEDTQGMPYAYLAALVRDVYCIGTDYAASLSYLRTTLGLAASAADQPKQVATGLSIPTLLQLGFSADAACSSGSELDTDSDF